MPIDINNALATFGPDDYTVRLVRGVCAAVPFAPELSAYRSLEEHLLQLEPKAKKPQLDRAKELSNAEDAQRALWIVDAIDKADAGISVFSGLKSAYSLAKSEQGQRLDALETDPQQAADAVLKGLALSYFIWKMFPGTAAEKVAAFRATPSGQALAFYYAAVELGLPFADNALTSGGTLLATLYEKYKGTEGEKFKAIAGPEAAAGAEEVMGQLTGPVDGIVKMASGSLQAIANAATTHLPGAMNVGDKVAGVVSTAADAMPVYRYLGTRVVAEVIARRALSEQPPSDRPAGASNNPALDEVKYTTKKADKNDIVVPAPPAKRGWCLIFALLLVAGPPLAGAASIAGLYAALS